MECCWECRQEADTVLPPVMGVEEGSGVLPQRPTETPTSRNDSTHGATQETPWLPDGYTPQPRSGNLNTVNHTTECQALLNTSRFRGDLQWDLALTPPHGSHVDPPSNAEPQDQGLQHQGQGSPEDTADTACGHPAGSQGGR